MAQDSSLDLNTAWIQLHVVHSIRFTIRLPLKAIDKVLEDPDHQGWRLPHQNSLTSIECFYILKQLQFSLFHLFLTAFESVTPSVMVHLVRSSHWFAVPQLFKGWMSLLQLNLSQVPITAALLQFETIWLIPKHSTTVEKVCLYT